MSLLDFFKANKEQWESTKAAEDFAPIPTGIYEMEAVSGKDHTSKNGIPGYKITWRVNAGDHTGRTVWQDLWLSPKALPQTKREFAKLGISPESPELREGIIAKVAVVLRTRDDGKQYNEVKRFAVMRIENDPFAPKAEAPTKTVTEEELFSTLDQSLEAELRGDNA